MKKNYFLLAAATMMLAACAETDLVNEVQESAPVAIDFDTFANKATRAANDLGDHHDNFAVWGYKNTATALVFNEQTVKSSDGTYTPKKYWDKAATTYEFYAAAPETADWTLNANTNAQNDDYFTLADFALTGTCLPLATATPTSSFASVNDVDLMIADATVNVVANNDPVALTFNHILSRLNITVKKGSTLTDDVVELILTSISVNNLVSNGSFDDSKTGAARWSAATTPAAYDINGQTTTVADATTYYVFQALVIPQDVAYEALNRDGSNVNASTSKPYLQINYTIGGEAYSATYNLASAFGSTSAAVSFLEGKQNTLNITIDADEIEFTASTADWAAGESDDI